MIDLGICSFPVGLWSVVGIFDLARGSTFSLVVGRLNPPLAYEFATRTGVVMLVWSGVEGEMRE